MSDEKEILEPVKEAKAPGVFNIIDVLQGRGYPKSTVDIYIDEEAIYDFATVREKLEELDNSINGKNETAKQKKLREELITEQEDIKRRIDSSKHTVHLMGISEGKREEYYRQAVKKYPVEYESQNGLSNLLGSGSQKVEKDSPERDALFTDYLWQGHIQKIVNPKGEEQEDFPYSTIRAMRESFPISSIVAINGAIEKLRASTALFTMETNEDFLAKP
jgi:hypothetical protein